MTGASDDTRAFAKPKLLVVEDDEAFRDLLTRQLEAMDCDVRITANASEFLATLTTASAPFDLAIVDINLPGLQGDQIITWIRESEIPELRNLPVLIVTGSPAGPHTSLLDRTNIEVLLKPYEYRELKAAVTGLLRGGKIH